MLFLKLCFLYKKKINFLSNFLDMESFKRTEVFIK